MHLQKSRNIYFVYFQIILLLFYIFTRCMFITPHYLQDVKVYIWLLRNYSAKNYTVKKETHRLGGMVQAKTTQDHHVIALSAEME